MKKRRVMWIVKGEGPFPYLGAEEPFGPCRQNQRYALRFDSKRDAFAAAKTWAAVAIPRGSLRVIRLVPKPLLRRVTRSRSLGMNTSLKNEVRWVPNTFAAGVYEVWCRGDRIAIVTDRWMADMIHSWLP